MTYNCDSLTYERQGMTFGEEGNEIGYHFMQSLDRPEWPANKFKGVFRGHVTTCCLFKREDNKVETFLLGELFPSGNLPQRLAGFNIAGKWIDSGDEYGRVLPRAKALAAQTGSTVSIQH
uniref:Uncharacterized protein n=1 Tax=Globisporangium ultimum (strain ATCC 200006 / CBS 805.95 / DAOM BR144) TaxID=431595 RepID=K3X116_GLOUD